MLNLLIREDRHWLRKEYLLRFVLVFLFFIMTSLFIWGTVIGSLYVQIKVEQNIVREELESVRETSDRKSLDDLLALEKKLNLLTDQLVVLNFEQTDLILEIVSKNQEGINVNLISNNLEISEDNKDEVIAIISLNGVANTRSDLVNYQEQLSESEMFETVNIPFSSFAQNTEIPFSASIRTVELNSYFDELEEESEEDVVEQAEETEENEESGEVEQIEQDEE